MRILLTALAAVCLAAPVAAESAETANTQAAQAAPAENAAGARGEDEQAEEDKNDPFEGMNRAIFHTNLVADHVIIRPIALGYRHIVPKPLRNSVRNFLNNLDSPPIFANQVFQGDLDEAGNTLVRFGINSTVGVGGLFEVAEDWGYGRETEDFGQTLGTYGIGEGPYLFLPLAGPAPPRDLFGRVVDFFLDPTTYVHMGNKSYLRYVRFGVDALDLRERNIETLDEIERTSVDYYATVRSLYRQTRNNEIRNGKAGKEELPDF